VQAAGRRASGRTCVCISMVASGWYSSSSRRISSSSVHCDSCTAGNDRWWMIAQSARGVLAGDSERQNLRTLMNMPAYERGNCAQRVHVGPAHSRGCMWVLRTVEGACACAVARSAAQPLQQRARAALQQSASARTLQRRSRVHELLHEPHAALVQTLRVAIQRRSGVLGVAEVLCVAKVLRVAEVLTLAQHVEHMLRAGGEYKPLVRSQCRRVCALLLLALVVPA
jgi:hypothetical protein